MALSENLVQQFAKLATADSKKTDEGSILNGVVKIIGDKEYVQIDGSDILTPVTSTVDIENEDRVQLLLKNHEATITGNITTPSASSTKLANMKDTVDEYGNTIKQLDNSIEQQGNSIIQINNSIKQQDDTINSFNNTINTQNNTIQALDNTVKSQGNDIVEMNNTINLQNGIISSVSDTVKSQGNSITAIDNVVKSQDTRITQNSTIIEQHGTTISEQSSNIETNNANIQVINSAFTINDGKVTGLSEIIVDDLETNNLNAKYATIDFANITEASVTKLFSESGIINDLVVSEGRITGELVGVTIKGDLIEGNTIKADKLVVKGSDGLYYKLNTDGSTVEAEQTDQNSLNGQVIAAKSITATKIAVDDLVAFGATIGGFEINNNSINTVTKKTVNATTAGLYIDKDGQLNVGDSDNYIKYYKDTDGQFKLLIKAESLTKEFSDTKQEITDLSQSISYLNVSFDKYYVIIPVDTNNKPLENGTAIVSITTLFKGAEVTPSNVTISGTHTGLSRSYSDKEITISYSNQDSITNLQNVYTVDIEYTNSGIIYKDTKSIVVSLVAQGRDGEKGEDGEQGEQGPKGDPGQNGNDAAIISDTPPEDHSKLWFNTKDNNFYVWTIEEDSQEGTDKSYWNITNDTSWVEGSINNSLDAAKNYADDLNRKTQQNISENYITTVEMETRISETAGSITEEFERTYKNDINEGLRASSEIDKMSAYIRRAMTEDGKPYVQLGADSDPFILRIENDSISIYNGVTVVSRWKTDTVETARVITEFLNLGKFSFIINDDESISFRKVR